MKTVENANLLLFALGLNLQLFASENMNKTTDNDLSVEMKEFYSDYIIDNAQPKLVHDQFGQKHPIPKGRGKTIEFRKFNPFPKALKPLTEGVKPVGQKMKAEGKTATVQQYGDYTSVSDVAELTTIDPMIAQATKLCGKQAGETLDSVTRDIINGGTSVQYGEDPTITARHLLVGGETEGNNYLTVRAIKMAARFLKTQNAEPFGDSFVAIIHPDISFDMTDDPNWKDVKTYCDPKDMYLGEIGKLYGVRFVETTEAKVFHADDLSVANRTLTIKSVAGNTVTINETLTAEDIANIVKRKVLVPVAIHEVVSATANTITLDSAPSVTTEGTVIYPGEAGAMGRDVYSTLVLGEDAYGVTEVTGGGLKHIYHPAGSAGAADPLNQESTVGWKCLKTAERLTEQFMVRIETTSTFEAGAN